ncbi:hypothetical protein GF324_03795 [bacterium]|nr:hypothetical protein [bacterium]
MNANGQDRRIERTRVPLRAGERIAVVQMLRFGDLVQTSPLLQSLRNEAAGDVEITLVVDRRAEPAARLLADVDEILPVDLTEAARLAGRTEKGSFFRMRDWVRSWSPVKAFDRVLLLNDDSLPAAVAGVLTAGLREGPMPGSHYGTPHRYLRAALSDRRFQPLHLSEIWAAYGSPMWPLPCPRIREEILGTGLALLQSEVSSSSFKTRSIALNLGAGGTERILQAATLAALTQQLLQRGDVVVRLLGTTADRGAATELIQRLPEHLRVRVRDWVGRTSLADLPGLLAGSDLLISTDTGTLQLAAALPMKTLGLFFNGANPRETGVFCEGAVAWMHKESLTGRPVDIGMELHPASLAENALRLLDGEAEQGGGPDDARFDVLVARHAPVAPVYRAAGGGDPGASERWQPLARRFLWGDAVHGVAFDSSGASYDGCALAPEARALLAGCLDPASQTSLMDSPEERWLRGLIQAFPNARRELPALTAPRRETTKWMRPA